MEGYVAKEVVYDLYVECFLSRPGSVELASAEHQWANSSFLWNRAPVLDPNFETEPATTHQMRNSPQQRCVILRQFRDYGDLHDMKPWSLSGPVAHRSAVGSSRDATPATKCRPPAIAPCPRFPVDLV